MVARTENSGSQRTARCPLCRAPVRARLPVDARATSGRPIEVISVPEAGECCHLDRAYSFLSLGGFAKPGMLYLLTSNDDRKTPSSQVMWVINASVPITVHLNYRSEQHYRASGVADWMAARGWRRNTSITSTKSSGYPNGPYSGPVFSRSCDAGQIELNGSNCWEGTYFVFIEPHAQPSADVQFVAVSWVSFAQFIA